MIFWSPSTLWMALVGWFSSAGKAVGGLQVHV